MKWTGVQSSFSCQSYLLKWLITGQYPSCFTEASTELQLVASTFSCYFLEGIGRSGGETSDGVQEVFVMKKSITRNLVYLAAVVGLMSNDVDDIAWLGACIILQPILGWNLELLNFSWGSSDVLNMTF